MKRNILTIAALAACTAFGPAQAQVSDGLVKIGVLNDMSGLYSDITGQGSVTAAKMAVEDYIKATKSTLKVEVVGADHQNKPDVGSNIARQWFDTDKVDMIADVPTSSVGLAIAQIAKDKGKLHVNSGSASADLTGKSCNANTIHWAYDTWMLANGTGKAIVKSGGNTWFFLTADYAFGHALERDTEAVVVKNGGKVLGKVRTPFPTQDFSSFLLQAQSSGAKVVGLANAGGDTVNSIKAASEFGLTKKQNLAALLMLISDVHAVGLNTAQGLYLTEGWYWNMNDESRKWASRFEATMKRKPNSNHASVYSSTLHYLNAVKAAGTDDTAAVMKKMRETPINDMFAKGGKLREDGRMVHDMYLFQVKSPAESKGPWDYYNLKGTVKGEDAFQSIAAGKCAAAKK